MNLNIPCPVISLEPGQVLRLEDAAGVTIKTGRGAVWITEEGDPTDFVIGPGQSRVVSRGGLTLVQAMEATRVSLREEVCPPAQVH